MPKKKIDVKPIDKSKSGSQTTGMDISITDEDLTRAKLGNEIRTILEEKGLKQREIADLLKIDQAEVSKLMSSKYQLFSEKRLLNFLGQLDRKIITIQVKEKNMSNTTRSTFSEMEWHKIQEAQKQMQDVMRQWPPKEFLMLEQQQRERFRSLDMSAASILQKKMAAMFEPLNRNRAFQEIIEQRKLIENLLTPEIRNQIEQSKELFKNLDTGSMARLQEEIQALTEEPFNNIQEVVRSYSEHIAEINSAINPLIEGLSLQIEEIQKAVSDPLTKALESYQQFLRDPFKDLFPEGFFDEIAQQKNFIDYCQEKGWVPHPVLYSFFGDDFFDLSDAEQEEKIQENWEEFSSFLWERLPHNLMGNGREQRLKQIYDAQKVGAYTPVCRSVYPEIESFAHEYLGSDTDFIESLKKISSGGMRIRAVSKKINTIFKIKESPIAKLYISDLGGLLGFRTMEVLLTKTRKEFVPFDETDDDSSINRHFHSHGIPYNASFKDSVNALLLLDTALQAFSALKDQIDGEPINNDH